LEAELKKLEGEIERFSKEAELKNAKSDILKEELNSTGEAVHAEEINLANIKVKKDSREETANKLKEEVEVLGLELDETRGAVDELAKKGEALNAELNDIEKESSALNLFINESQTMMANKREAREALSLKLATMRAENQAIDKEWENITGNLKKEKAILTESEETLRVKGELSRDSAEKARSFSEEIAALEARNSDISGGLEILSEELSKVEKERSDAADKLGICEIQLKEREGETEHLRNQIRDLDVKLAETNYKKASLKERINQAYKTDIETLHMELDDNTDMDALRGQVGEIKEKLDKMGPVNLVAIEEHKELEERHSFLVHQQEDLLNAKDSLLKAIQKINKTTKELFMDTFQKIQLEFKNFFRLLFGGGQAEVVLMDEQDVLESGIEIIVRPPGKKLQNITLLSGGEKALTAIALLFAVFKVKPSPFCVLDEIDAPLDESNVGRFSNVLKDFLKMSQFIIITHNKRTIELADVMYGITMQERGVSKVVSVKFSEKEGIPRKAVTVPQPA
jgi:chromosome segregation protein